MSYPGKAQIVGLLGGTWIAGALDWIVDTLHAQPFRIGGANVRSGNGVPEGAVAGMTGDVYLRQDGGASTSFYVKESSPTPKTGWIAK